MGSFYENYLRLCNKVNKSPSGVALEIGMSKTAVNGWKHGRTNPTDATAKKLADYFGVSVDALMGENKNKPVSIGNEPLSLDYLRTLSTEQLLQIMKDATQALSEK